MANLVFLESCLWAAPHNAQNKQLQNHPIAPVSKPTKNSHSSSEEKTESIPSKNTARQKNLATHQKTANPNQTASINDPNISQDSLAKLLDSIAWNETIHTFEGGVPTGPPATFKFEFTNYSAHPIKVKGVEAACSCTATDFSRKEVPPGSSGWIQTAYKTENTFGFFKKYVDVFFEGSPNKHRLYLTGSVDPYKKL
jgi:hypothetical protein